MHIHLDYAKSAKSDNDGYGSNIRRDRPNAFSNQALGMAGICRLSYAGVGSPFSIILEESGVTTTCNLNTYEPESPEEIPFQRVSDPKRNCAPLICRVEIKILSNIGVIRMLCRLKLSCKLDGSSMPFLSFRLLLQVVLISQPRRQHRI